MKGKTYKYEGYMKYLKIWVEITEHTYLRFNQIVISKLRTGQEKL